MFNVIQALAGIFFELTRVSKNRKTGPIATTRASMNSCPDDCPLKDNVCYANRYPLKLWWLRVPERGTTLDGFVRGLKKLVKNTMLRLNEAGDFPGAANLLFRDACLKIAKASAHLTTWTYTHYRPERGENEDIIREMNQHITVNLSANNFKEADAYFALDLPVVCTVPQEFPTHGVKTPNGVPVAVCPFETGKTENCQTCGNGNPLCHRQNRNYIIGFLPSGKKGHLKIADIFFKGLKKRGLTSGKKNERMAGIMKYRELMLYLNQLPAEKLDMDVTIQHPDHEDEFFTAVIADEVESASGILDEGHPVICPIANPSGAVRKIS